MSLNEVLVRFRAIGGIDLAAVATTDGLLVESVAHHGVDAEAICAVAANGLALAESLGREVKKGEAVQTLLQYEQGLVLIEHLSPDAMLLLLTNGQQQLGRLRFLVRKHQAALVAALDAI